MVNEQDGADIEKGDDTELDLDEGAEDKPKPESKEKPPKEFSLEEKLARVNRMKARYEKELGIEPESKPKDKSDKKVSSDLDFGHLAFYNSKSNSVKIEADEDIEFVKNTIQETGKSQKDILASKWFQAELKERQEARATVNAVPKGTPRSTQPAPSDEHYWLSKIETGQAQLNDIPDRSLREKVLNARIEKEKSNSMFSSQPIIHGGI